MVEETGGRFFGFGPWDWVGIGSAALAWLYVLVEVPAGGGWNWLLGLTLGPCVAFAPFAVFLSLGSAFETVDEEQGIRRVLQILRGLLVVAIWVALAVGAYIALKNAGLSSD